MTKDPPAEELERIPTFREVIRDELGVDVPGSGEEITEIWRGLAPHLEFLLAVWAIGRIGFRWPEWLGGAADQVKDYLAQLGDAGDRVKAVFTAAAMSPASSGTFALLALLGKQRRNFDRVRGEDPCAELEAILEGETNSILRREIQRRLDECRARRDADPDHRTSLIPILREKAELVLDVYAAAIVVAFTVKEFDFGGIL